MQQTVQIFTAAVGKTMMNVRPVTLHGSTSVGEETQSYGALCLHIRQCCPCSIISFDKNESLEIHLSLCCVWDLRLPLLTCCSNTGGSLVPWGLEKKYDVAYSNQGGEWNDWARNWTLAKPSFIQLIEETNATVLILGRDLTQEADLQPYIASGNIVSREKALWRDFLKLIEESRSLVTFNVHDASPRVLAEAMCMDVPVLVNWHILGGWKYATEQTGEDFKDTASFIAAYKRLREPERKAKLHPRDWYRYTHPQRHSVICKLWQDQSQPILQADLGLPLPFL